MTASPRTILAVLAVKAADQWAKIRSADGTKYYGIADSREPDRRYLVNCRTCTCQPHRETGALCWHILAVKLYVAQVRLAQRNERFTAERDRLERERRCPTRSPRTESPRLPS